MILDNISFIEKIDDNTYRISEEAIDRTYNEWWGLFQKELERLNIKVKYRPDLFDYLITFNKNDERSEN